MSYYERPIFLTELGRIIPNWQQYDRKLVKKINALLSDIGRDNPYEGIGKPEPLKACFFWVLVSADLMMRHRLVYRVL